ncbi:MAG: hypothetical protein RRZ69_01305 [Clostridia bacterium]
MKIELKLMAIRGVLSKNSFLLADDEALEIVPTNLKGLAYLQVNGKTFGLNGGSFVVYGKDLNETNTLTLIEIVDGNRKSYFVGSLVVYKPIDKTRLVENEIVYYKNQIEIMRQSMAELEEFKAIASSDIKTLTEAYNTLVKEFKAMREEMSY